ncbi:GNAT family N-acetyltransferase [Sphingomonas baiyangensis]|uniref:GNAT family N-acetyltransferase n=1 Tax=Sphingomonas baiyangensis TaxID=2572576 RepID=A0A4U1L876_9SPHN|nr:GNAT family N-acetyltransferase [Sphingomonas baiyangensis]TKD53157.1 GNAT family N-acetyltransferase [Sphingomonas baiyangensis]
MSAAIELPLSFRIGARTLLRLRRRLVRVALPLDAAMAGEVPALPPLPAGADGYSLLSVPLPALPALRWIAGPMLAHERQRYRRYCTDLSIGRDAWLAGLSGNLRSSLKRKRRKLADASGGAIDIRRYRTPEELAAFHAIARPLAAETYQEKLLAMGLPGDPAFIEAMLRRAAAGSVRAWLLFIGGVPAAYLYCPVEGDCVLYEYVGHAESFDALSPGTLLMAEALGDLLDEAGGPRWFDFTEGEGQLKRQFATHHVECADLLLLRPGIANRSALAALGAWDGAVARAKKVRARLAR